LWATFYSVTKGALTRFDPIVFSFLEIASILPIALVIVILLRAEWSNVILKHGILLGCSLYLAVFTSTIALKFTTATNTAFYPSLNGLIATLITVLVLRKSVAASTWLAGLISAAGAFLLIYEAGMAIGLWGDIVALLGAVFYTIYIFVVDREAEVSLSARQLWLVFGIEIIVMGILAGGVSIFLGDWDFGRVRLPQDLSIVLYVGVATTFLPTAISILMQRYVEPITVAFLYVTEPIWSAIIAYVYLTERVSFKIYIGGFLIIVGAILHTIIQRRKDGMIPSAQATL
jgi:drug/metabolite transporter (DMT)-like permease